jgi:glycogen(starch) synthase
VIRDDLIAPDTVAHNVIERAAWTAAISHGALEPVLRNVPGIADRSSVIYNGCPPPSLDPAPLPFAPPRMLCVGRLVHRKGFHHALNALALLLPRFPRVEMIIAGDGPDGPDLRRQAAALGIDRQVTFTGWIAPERIFDLMNGVTAVLMPSLPEGLGNVAIQAALMSRPVIGSRVAGLTEIVVPDETGLLVEPENDEALTAAMAWLIEHHADAIRMGETARLRAADVFGWSKCVDAYAELYERVGRADRN